MNNDFTFEESVHRDNGKMGVLFPILSVSALIIFIFFFNLIPIVVFGQNIIFVTGMISFGLCYLVYRACRKLKFDYEIEIINDSFSITKVIAQKKRMELCDFSIKECEHIGPVTEERFIDDKFKCDFDFNCTSKRNFEVNDDTWYAIVPAQGFKYAVIFEFRKPMYKIFRRFNPRNVFIMPMPKEEDEDNEE